MARISEIMLLQQMKQPAIVMEHSVGIDQLPQIIGESFLKLDAYLQESEVVVTDIPFVCFPEYTCMTPDRVKVVVGLKTPRLLPEREEIHSRLLPARKIVTCLYRGSNVEIASLYAELEEWIRKNGYTAEGSTFEYYYTGPDFTEHEQVTRIELSLL